MNEANSSLKNTTLWQLNRLTLNASEGHIKLVSLEVFEIGTALGRAEVDMLLSPGLVPRDIDGMQPQSPT